MLECRHRGRNGSCEGAVGHWSRHHVGSMIESMDTPAERISPIGLAIDSARPGRTVPDERDVLGRPTAILRLLLATDLSLTSERASDEAIRLAVEWGAQLVVLSIVDPARRRLPGELTVRRVDQERERIEAGVQKVVRRARAAHVRATFLVWEGDPAEAILAVSDAENVDLIVLGSNGRGRLGRQVVGSVSPRVTAEAHCRVLVVAR